MKLFTEDCKSFEPAAHIISGPGLQFSTGIKFESWLYINQLTLVEKKRQSKITEILLQINYRTFQDTDSMNIKHLFHSLQLINNRINYIETQNNLFLLKFWITKYLV